MSYISETDYAELHSRYREASMLADKYELIVKTKKSIIESLRKTNDDLRRMLLKQGEENAELRRELEQWHKLTENIELPEYPICKFQPKDLERENAELRELESENCKLREELDAAKYDLSVFSRALVDASCKRDKLCELARDMYGEMRDCDLICSCRFERRMRELGIEEDDD